MTADTDIKGVGAEAKSCGAESAGDAIIDQAAQVQCGEPVVDATNATVATSGDASRPSNEEIIAQENAIRKEQEGRQLVGVIERTHVCPTCIPMGSICLALSRTRTSAHKSDMCVCQSLMYVCVDVETYVCT